MSNLRDKYPDNSRVSRLEKKEDKIIKPVITGRVKRQKKPFTRKLFDTFIGEEVDDVGHYIIWDVLVPAARNTVSEILHNTTDVIFGTSSKKKSAFRREKGRSYFSYSNISNKDDRKSRSSRNRARSDFDDIQFQTRADAEEVLYQLAFLTENYQMATVRDFYELVGESFDHTDEKWGWESVSSGTVDQLRGGRGYILNLPRPILLD